MAEAVDYKQIGTRPVRPDGVDKVTGRARFGADLILPNMIHGRVLRSPHAHARIKSIDLSGALKKRQRTLPSKNSDTDNNRIITAKPSTG